jgi:glycosyltransferase 2 family protein
LAHRKRRIAVAAQWVAAAIVIGFAAREVARQWREIGPALAALHPSWSLVFASGAIVLATYLVLVEAWRATLRIWKDSLPFAAAARIWFVSNLGKYVPGKVWQIAAMGAMAQRAGVSASAAVGSSLLVNLVNIVTGFAVMAVASAGRVADAVGGTDTAGRRTSELAVIAIAAIGGLALLIAPVAIPRLATLAGRVTGKTLVIPPVPYRALWISAAATATAWVLYGIAFALFAHGISPRATGTASSYIAVYTGSYLAGYLALFAPGGIGVREAVLVLAMPRFGLLSAPDAAVVAIASRLWLTVLEIGPGLLLWARPHRSNLQQPS